ncbi:hypothetical protein SAMN06265368_2166 [Cohaesibacter gelatinilyticus]|uniref:Glyoxalase-related protein domain-containing protein n=2 Tax=Cohaesibacter gelatinilyticus TaxID=372072 RepID=A0A285PCX2_9HYPH|nr:hypothetical protein SAMN06265368_2166 [Cohaesibacter gelatinilyticus]
MSNISLPSLTDLKAEAKKLRAQASEAETPLSHSQALEQIAKRYGYRNWNVIAAAANQPKAGNRFYEGMRLSGHYLSQPFAGKVLKVQPTEQQGSYQLTILFDQPVDVVSFESFSAFRQRVSCTIGPDGTSPQQTSNGEPHMRLDL